MTSTAQPSGNPTKCALIVVDMQNGFCDPRGYFALGGRDVADAQRIIPVIADLADQARRASIPVIFLRYWLAADYSNAGLVIEVDPALAANRGLIAGSWDAQIVDQLRPPGEDLVIDKTRYSGFHETGLEHALRELGAETVVLCGVTTGVCVESTARDAFARDFRTVVVSDATAEPDPRRHAAAIEAMTACGATVTTAATAIAELSSPPPRRTPQPPI